MLGEGGSLVVGKVHVDKGTMGQNGRIGAPRSVLVLLAVLLLALGAAALASAGGSGADGYGPLAGQWWLIAVVAIGVGIVAVVKLRQLVVVADPETAAEARLHRGALALAAVATAVVPIVLFFLHSHDDGAHGAGVCAVCPVAKQTSTVQLIVHTNDAVTKPGQTARTALPMATILFVLVGLVVVVVAAVAAIGLWRWWRERDAIERIGGAPLPSMAEAEEDESALGLAVLAGRDALAGEARAAIIACYAAMETSLTEAGVPRLESDSPADLLARATQRGVVDGPAPRLLAALFREARYSSHPMDTRHLDQARGALDEIAAQLTARQEAEAR